MKKIAWGRKYGISWKGERLVCPECGEVKFKSIYQCVAMDGAQKLRNKRCLTCGAEWLSVEIDAERYAELLDKEEQFEGIYAKCREIRKRAVETIDALDDIKAEVAL